MRLSELGEFGLIKRIGRATPKGHGVRLGIGDDAAWVSHPGGSSLITSDLLIEGIHFDLRWTSILDLGIKTLAVNLSDIAAMGGTPAYVVISLGIPGHFDSAKIDEFYRGIRSLASKTDVSLVGGDTNLSPVFVISVCVVGHAPHRPITRGGARSGDDIYVTGTLGDSALALARLRGRNEKPRGKLLRDLMARHHRPTPRLIAGSLLARKRLATAMIDISDGLLQDLGHICRASDVGAVLLKDSLPLSTAYRTLCGADELDFALAGGEDYELLFCARPHSRAAIGKLQRRARVPMTRIGYCVAADHAISVRDQYGKPLDLRIKGHDHFK